MAPTARTSEATPSIGTPLPKPYERVFREFDRRLGEGRLNDGHRFLSERQLAEALGVASTDMREALRVLEFFGVVATSTAPGFLAHSVIRSGAEVRMAIFRTLCAQLTSFDTAEVVQIRQAIERSAARLAAVDPCADDVAELRLLIDGMRSSPSVASYIQLDATFHTRMMRFSEDGSGTMLLATLYEVQRAGLVAAFKSARDSLEVRRSLTNRLSDFVDAVAARDGSGAAEIVSGYIEAFYTATGFSERTRSVWSVVRRR